MFYPHPTPKHTTTPFLQNTTNITILLLIVTPVGAPNSGMLSGKEFNCHSLNSKAWVVPLSCVPAAPSHGKPNNKRGLLWVWVRLKYKLPTLAWVSQSTLEIWFPPSPLSVTQSVTPKPQHHYTTIARRVLNGVTIWQPRAIATLNNVSNAVQEWVANGILTVSHVSGKTNIADIVMVQTSNASETLSCAAQAITTSASTVLSKTLPCFCKWSSILNRFILAFSRFSSLTAAFVFWRPCPAFQAPAAISYLVLHPLFLCRLLWAIQWGVFLRSLLIPVIVYSG